MAKKITYDDTRDIAINCVDELIDLGVLKVDMDDEQRGVDDGYFEVQDLIQDEFNKLLGLDAEDNWEIIITSPKKLGGYEDSIIGKAQKGIEDFFNGK